MLSVNAAAICGHAAKGGEPLCEVCDRELTRATPLMALVPGVNHAWAAGPHDGITREIVSALKPVDEVFVEESLEQKREYLLRHKADVLVMGDDWEGKFDHFSSLCEVVYLPRTLAGMAEMTQARSRELVRVSYAKVAEYQRRGLVHLHAVIRLDRAMPAEAGAAPFLLLLVLGRRGSRSGRGLGGLGRRDFDRRNRTVSILAPISRLASGIAQVELLGGGRIHTADPARGRFRSFTCGCGNSDTGSRGCSTRATWRRTGWR